MLPGVSVPTSYLRLSLKLVCTNYINCNFYIVCTPMILSWPSLKQSIKHWVIFLIVKLSIILKSKRGACVISKLVERSGQSDVEEEPVFGAAVKVVVVAFLLGGILRAILSRLLSIIVVIVVFGTSVSGAFCKRVSNCNMSLSLQIVAMQLHQLATMASCCVCTCCPWIFKDVISVSCI